MPKKQKKNKNTKNQSHNRKDYNEKNIFQSFKFANKFFH